MSYAQYFSRFLGSDPDRLHAAAHSHHPWPDVSFEAHQQAWLDAADRHDDKWDHVFGTVFPEAKTHIATRLGLSDPDTIALGTNTHSFVMRILSCLPTPTRIVTTDGEFHSFDRQARRLVEDGSARVTHVPVEPFDTFPDRFVEAVASTPADLVYLSQVFFDSGFVVPALDDIVAAVPSDDTFVVIDGYHGFMALPTDLSAIEDRAFYVAGGYKYAMAGEGACFLHCPPGYGQRPVDTGWYAGFATLEDSQADVGYAEGGDRFLGATFDPTGFYRFTAVQRWLHDIDLDVAAIHDHVGALQTRLLETLGGARPGELLPPSTVDDRGHFLTFRTPDAERLYRRFHEHRIVTDRRGDRWRIGLGIYHDEDDVDRLADTIRTTEAS
ncbi:MAG: aminotransferase class V-fold PLP-dependent enzyme [Nitriliruptorales bacterium]|nr:aminotransferase class V-fold PLP-dependent enzyme [Nitriliruptorales bacterium]